MNRTENELEDLGIIEFCPKRETKQGRPPVITGKATTSNRDQERFGPWKPPAKIPNKGEKKKMLSEALKIAIEFIMKNHIYTFKNITKKQSKGGPIGLELTGELAAVFMMWWDKELLKRVQNLGIEVLLYKRYVDDINMVIKLPKERNTLMKGNNREYRLTEE